MAAAATGIRVSDFGELSRAERLVHVGRGVNFVYLGKKWRGGGK